jgi:hypothetical protein
MKLEVGKLMKVCWLANLPALITESRKKLNLCTEHFIEGWDSETVTCISSACWCWILYSIWTVRKLGLKHQLWRLYFESHSPRLNLMTCSTFHAMIIGTHHKFRRMKGFSFRIYDQLFVANVIECKFYQPEINFLLIRCVMNLANFERLFLWAINLC